MNTKKLNFYIWLAGIIAVGVVVDMVSKVLTVGVNNVTVIPYVLSFQYTENHGAAWGIFAGQMIFLIIITSLILAGFMFYIYKNKHKTKTFLASSALIIAGGMGNLIDRIFNPGYVRDFLRFDFLNYVWNPMFGKDFPICNVADLLLSAGIVVLFVYFIFQLPKLEKKEKING